MTDSSGQDDGGQDDGRQANEPPILNAASSAMTAFVLAVLVLMGNNLMVQGTQSLFGLLFTGDYDDATFLVTWLFGALLPAVAALGLGRRAFTDPSAAGWEQNLGRGAFLLALVAVLYTLVLMVGGIIHDPF